MHIRHAQRKHIIHSLDTLLYQLHALSFFLAPSVWSYLCRVIAQSQFQRPREIDAKRSLRFWFIIIACLNVGSIWSHATTNRGEGRSVMLDFVGMAHTPSMFHMLALDVLIITLTMLLTTIAYEHSLLNEMPADSIDPLQPVSDASSSLLSPLDNSKVTKTVESPFVMEVRLAPLIDRLRNPAPAVRPRARNVTDQELLPLPNIVPWQRFLLRSRQRTTQTRDREDLQEDDGAAGGGARTIPGALDTEERP